MTEAPEDLSKRIQDAREKQNQRSPLSGLKANGGDRKAVRQALRAASDLVAALMVGGFLGYWMDKWLDTSPLFMIVMFFMGFMAGFLNIYRAQMGQDFKIGFGHKKKAAKDNKEE